MLKRVFRRAAAAALVALVLAGCSSSDSTPPPTATAKIRVVHASPDIGPIDVYISPSVTPWLEDVAYGTAGVYLSRSTGTATLVIRRAGDDPATAPVFTSNPIDLAAGASLTVLAAGLAESLIPEDGFRLVPYADSFQNNPNARTRVVHAGADGPNVDVYLGSSGKRLAEDLPRYADSGQGGVFYEAGLEQDIAVQASASQVVSFRAPELEARKDYYFFLIGLISNPGAATTPFDLLIVGPGGALDLETVTDRDFRLVHASPDGGTVDAYVTYGLGDGFERKLIQASLPYGEASSYRLSPGRQVIIEIHEEGSPPGFIKFLFSQSVNISDEAGSTTVIAAGLAASDDEADEVRLLSLADDFGFSIGGLALSRIVHACPNLDHLRVYFDGLVDGAYTAGRFSANTEGPFTLSANEAHTMEVRNSGLGTLVDFFITPAMTADKDYYLILTGIKDGAPGFTLLSVNEDGSQGFTPPN